MSFVLKCCGVLAMFAFAVLANPITTELEKGAVLKTEDKIAVSDIHDMMMNDGEEDTGAVEAPLNAPTSQEALPDVSNEKPDAPESEASKPSSTPTSMQEALPTIASTPDKSEKVPFRKPVAREGEETPTEAKPAEPASSGTTSNTGTTAKPAAATTAANTNGSNLTSPNGISFGALTLMLIVKMFG